MIRAATINDKVRIVQLLKDAHESTGMTDPGNDYAGFMFPFDAAYMERLFLRHLNDARAVCFVADEGGVAQGVLMATAVEHPFGPVWLAQETTWWIDPNHRGLTAFRMLDAYETWAKAQGCNFVGMSTKANPMVAKLYERRGYRLAETHYLKPAQ